MGVDLAGPDPSELRWGSKLLHQSLGMHPPSTTIGDGGYNVESKGPSPNVCYLTILSHWHGQVNFHRFAVKYVGRRFRTPVGYRIFQLHSVHASDAMAHVTTPRFRVTVSIARKDVWNM
jgi:hypothetical protein